jgi:hypothetical protein
VAGVNDTSGLSILKKAGNEVQRVEHVEEGELSREREQGKPFSLKKHLNGKESALCGKSMVHACGK